MRQVKSNDALKNQDFTKLHKDVGSDLRVRSRPRRRYACSRAHRAEPALLLSWRAATHVRQIGSNRELATLNLPKLTAITEDIDVRSRPRPCSADRARAAARIAPSLPAAELARGHACVRWVITVS